MHMAVNAEYFSDINKKHIKGVFVCLEVYLSMKTRQ